MIGSAAQAHRGAYPKYFYPSVCNPVALESVMRDADRLFQAFTTIADHQNELRSHPADDYGWPLCACEACVAKTNRMNAAFIDSILRGGGDPERIARDDVTRHQDYDGDGGRGAYEEWRDNNPRNPSVVLAPAWQKLPVIEAPSIVPAMDAASQADATAELPEIDAHDLSLFSEVPETGEVGEDEDTPTKAEDI